MEGWHHGGNMAFLNLIIVLACIQIVVLIGLVMATFFVKLNLERKGPIKLRRRESFRQALLAYPNIGPETLTELNKHLHMTFVVFLELDDALPQKKAIVGDIFAPQVSQRAHARLWYDRYMAAVILQYMNRYRLDGEVDALIIQLLHDPIALVAINAFKALAFRPNQRLLNEAIEVFSKFRRSQLELMVSVLTEADLELVSLIEQRLLYETDPLIRAFCYRMLVDLPKVSFETPYMPDDLSSESLSLALAAISYVNYLQKPLFKEILQQGLKQPRWQIKARCLKYLGRSQDEQQVELIQLHLSDEVWWVRFRAAEALSQLGAPGLKALENAKLSMDKFAKQMASQRMAQIEWFKEEGL
jgi:hypothetical protein